MAAGIVEHHLANEGLVSVGIDHDTAEFAVESIKRWWKKMGQTRYPNATELLITADGGGSNGSRNRLWKVKLQDFVNESGLKISVCHFPPGTSKWNKIEHRMFSYISMNWRGRPLMSLETIVNLMRLLQKSKKHRVVISTKGRNLTPLNPPVNGGYRNDRFGTFARGS